MLALVATVCDFLHRVGVISAVRDTPPFSPPYRRVEEATGSQNSTTQHLQPYPNKIKIIKTVFTTLSLHIGNKKINPTTRF